MKNLKKQSSHQQSPSLRLSSSLSLFSEAYSTKETKSNDPLITEHYCSNIIIFSITFYSIPLTCLFIKLVTSVSTFFIKLLANNLKEELKRHHNEQCQSVLRFKYSCLVFNSNDNEKHCLYSTPFSSSLLSTPPFITLSKRHSTTMANSLSASLLCSEEPEQERQGLILNFSYTILSTYLLKSSSYGSSMERVNCRYLDDDDDDDVSEDEQVWSKSGFSCHCPIGACFMESNSSQLLSSSNLLSRLSPPTPLPSSSEPAQRQLILSSFFIPNTTANNSTIRTATLSATPITITLSPSIYRFIMITLFMLCSFMLNTVGKYYSYLSYISFNYQIVSGVF